MSEVVSNTAGNVAYLPTAKAVVTGLPALKGVPRSGAELGAAPTQPVVKRMESPGDSLITYWGEANDYPQKVIEIASKSTIIPAAIADKSALWVAGGVIATADKESTEMVDDDEIYKFLTDTTFERYLIECASDVSWWWNAFPEFILSRDRSKINQLHNNETAYCRWGRQNESTGLLDTVYFNANWPNANALDKETEKLTAIDPYLSNRVDWVRTGSKDFKFVYPLSLPSPGKSFYQLAPWDATRTSGWLDYLFSIPQFKKFGMQNKMTLRYHIEVPAEYWSKVYGERWDNGSVADKLAIRDEFLSSMTEKLTNVENANKAVMTDTWFDDQDRGRDQVGIKITVLDDKEKEGKYNEDYSDGQANLLYALGTDPSLFGFQSKDIQRSGGSDKSQSFNIFIAKSTPYRSRILEPLKFIAEYNGWKKRFPRLTFKFDDTLMKNLSTGAPIAKTATAP
ncbi:hypothetical protein [Spirosoma sordidisoli]|uniref:Phage portal protein n=1 Tax=Spirosoma sordidisoli TaxID=2502893 RepID=A0A4Q2UQ34_9BACT|nr:hypothetical protein [Spirosoma sordidisoli]RYC69755.1 hypothetical protein EQG79_14260 [Spirosoma sordidisoli]